MTRLRRCLRVVRLQMSFLRDDRDFLRVDDDDSHPVPPDPLLGNFHVLRLSAQQLPLAYQSLRGLGKVRDKVLS